MKNKIVLITGAASGIGAATARNFVAAGAKVFASDVNKSGLQVLIDELGEAVTGHQADMSDRAQVETMVASCVERLGALDVLVNNAGVGSLARAVDLDPDEWRRVMAIDLDSIFWAARVAMPHLIASRGCMVNTASISGIAADYGFTVYNTAKAGVINLTRALALDYASQGVRVNAVSPGLIETPLSVMRPALAEEWESRIPMRRKGKAEEIAAVIAFLASEAASYITGQNIVVDGGITAHTGQPDVPGFTSTGSMPR